MSTSIVLLVLAAGWCTYLAMWWKDARRTAMGRSDGIRSFTAGMGTLGGSTGRIGPDGAPTFSLRPRSSFEAARRRQELFTVLGTLAVVTLLGSFVFGAAMLLLHVVIDSALLGYAYAVVQRRNLAAEREIKVQMLHPERAVVDLAPARRHTVNA